jgi:succinate dehydrogenase/fumarate reductase flavoprotein subunit
MKNAAEFDAVIIGAGAGGAAAAYGLCRRGASVFCSRPDRASIRSTTILAAQAGGSAVEGLKDARDRGSK